MSASGLPRPTTGRTALPVARDFTPARAPQVPPARDRRVRPCPTPHLSVDQYVRLLAFLWNEGGMATLDQVSRALPRVKQPVSAVFDLCDAGVLDVDRKSAFDGDMRVWCVVG